MFKILEVLQEYLQEETQKFDDYVKLSREIPRIKEAIEELEKIEVFITKIYQASLNCGITNYKDSEFKEQAEDILKRK